MIVDVMQKQVSLELLRQFVMILGVTNQDDERIFMKKWILMTLLTCGCASTVQTTPTVDNEVPADPTEVTASSRRETNSKSYLESEIRRLDSQIKDVEADLIQQSSLRNQKKDEEVSSLRAQLSDLETQKVHLELELMALEL